MSRRKKQISIDQLRPGMHILGLDQSWLKSTVWFHRGLIKSEGEIRKLRESGVRMVFIDPELGVDAEEPADETLLNEPPQLPAEPDGPPPQEEPEGAIVEVQSQEPKGEEPRHETASQISAEDLAVVRQIRNEAVFAVERIFDGIKTGKPLEVGSVQEVTQTLMDCLTGRDGAMLAETQLQRMKQFDTSLFNHSVDVCVLALVIGHRIEVPQDQLIELGIGALLHDVGQMRLPRNLLLKSGAFTEQERSLFQSHPKLGATMISSAEGFSEITRRVVSEHHERIDGSGYPWGRKGSSISRFGQLVGVIDRYDALVSSRGGRPSVPPALAVRRMYQMGQGGEFEMEWIERLIQSLSLYPIGSLVELNTGERGWVIGVNQADRMRPTVRLLWDRDRRKLEESITVELSRNDLELASRYIQEVLNPLEEGVSQELSLAFSST